MLHYALLFFVLALVFGFLGFGGYITGTLLWAAQALVVVFIILFIVSLVYKGGRPDPYV